MYYTYMLRCSDNSIYTGMTNNLEKRKINLWLVNWNIKLNSLRNSKKKI